MGWPFRRQGLEQNSLVLADGNSRSTVFWAKKLLIRLFFLSTVLIMSFMIIGKITNISVIAAGISIRELPRLRKFYGPGRWRKLKGTAKVRLPIGIESEAEIHWYEAHGIGKKEFKIKRLLG